MLLFEVNLDRCAGSCNTLDNLFDKACVPNATKDLNLHAFELDNINKPVKNINNAYIKQM